MLLTKLDNGASPVPRQSANPMRIACFTIASGNYGAYVRVLLDSLRDTNPGFSRYLCLADVPQGDSSERADHFHVVRADQIGIPHFEDFAFRYDIMEFNTAVKPSMFKWLFANTDADAVIYLDPDIRCYGALSEVERLLADGASVVATPHVMSPLEDGRRPNDRHLLQAGVFNLGFLAVARCDESAKYLDWWARRMATECLNDIPNALFVDQKWCDLLPCHVERLAVLRHPGYNVAYWNLTERKVEPAEDGKPRCNGKPLAFFHFSGVNPAAPDILSKHQDRFDLADLPAVRELVRDYVRQVNEAGWQHNRKTPYAYGAFDDGTPIPEIVRKVYRRHHAPGEFGSLSPFAVGAAAICNAPASGLVAMPDLPISRVMQEIHRIRPDIQSLFNLDTREGRRSFLHWFEASAGREYGLPAAVVGGTMAAHSTQGAVPPDAAPMPASDRAARSTTRRYRRMLAIEQAGSRYRSWFPAPLRGWLKRHWVAYKAGLLRRF